MAKNHGGPSDQTPGQPSEAWARICRRLRVELGEDVYVSWFGRLELDRIFEGVAYLSVPTRFLKSWLESHYADKVLHLFKVEAHGVARLVIQLRATARLAPPRQVSLSIVSGPGLGEAPSPMLKGAEKNGADTTNAFTPFLTPPAGKETTYANGALSGSPLDRRLTFNNFLIGKSNHLAHAAGQRVSSAREGDPVVYNPLYVHASVGLGKTHLLQAIAHAAQDSGRRVIYLTAEKFMYSFVLALKAQTALVFKEKLREIDFLIIDDLQFLVGRSMQLEFCHTINALIDSGKQIVVAADRPPADLENLDERVSSRLASGLCAEMTAPDEALRTKMLHSRIGAAQALHPNFEVPAPVLAYVAKVIVTNGRDLEGAVSRLLAHTTLTGEALSVEAAEGAIRDLVRTRDLKRVKIEDIQKLVAGHYNVSRADILSSRRTAVVVRPRQIAMYLSKVLTLRSLPEIGRRFGGRDHTTVLHAVRKIEGLTATDKALSEELELLKRMLQE